MKSIHYLSFLLFFLLGLQSPTNVIAGDCKTKIAPHRVNGKIELKAHTRGVAPFTYRWSTGENTQSIVVTKPGKYCVKVTDAEGCESDACFELKRPGDGDKCRTVIVPYRSDNGVKLTARTKGKAPFTYRWSTGENTQSIVVTKPGKYCVKVTDAEGCESGACFKLKRHKRDGKRRLKDHSTELRNTTSEENAYIRDIKVYPVPVSDLLNVEIEGAQATFVDLKIIDMEGRVQWHNTAVLTGNRTTLEYRLSGLTTGQYLLHVTTSASSKRIKFIKL